MPEENLYTYFEDRSHYHGNINKLVASSRETLHGFCQLGGRSPGESPDVKRKDRKAAQARCCGIVTVVNSINNPLQRQYSIAPLLVATIRFLSSRKVFFGA